jgi:hypothetical protein
MCLSLDLDKIEERRLKNDVARWAEIGQDITVVCLKFC